MTIDNTTDDLQPPPELDYVGFGARLMASIIDGAIIITITAVMLALLYGSVASQVNVMPADLTFRTFLQQLFAVQGTAGFLIRWVFPTVYAVTLLYLMRATPGKYLLGMAVVDAKTGKRATARQYSIRELAEFISFLVLFLGYFWIIWDKRKQAWHDKLAGTVVIVNEDRKIDL